jgi:hypothetical protein
VGLSKMDEMDGNTRNVSTGSYQTADWKLLKLQIEKL